jgi:hypothetical protein
MSDESYEKAKADAKLDAAFTREDEGKSPGIDADGNLRRGEHEAPSRGGMIPGVKVTKFGKPILRSAPRGTAGWKEGTGEIHPRVWGAVRPAKMGILSDDPEVVADLVYDLLRQRRVRVLRKSLTRKGKPNAEEALARTYLTMLLKTLDSNRRLDGTKGNYSTLASGAAAELLLMAPPHGEQRAKAMRKIGDLRRKPVSRKEQMRFAYDFLGDMGRVAAKQRLDLDRAALEARRLALLDRYGS